MTSAARIEWNPGTLTLIQPGGGYARIIRLQGERRLQSRELVCAYEFARTIWVRHSGDDGRTWREPVPVAADWPHGALANAELLPLRSGALLCLYNQRPAPAPNSPPFAICVARSEDGGRSWQTPVTLYSAGTEFSNGCWEPAGIQLPSGEVQVFFANEGPYRHSDEQEITLLRSRDDARTWSRPETASFRAGFRDGMPSPLVLQSGRGERRLRGIAVAIEDNGLGGSFKPVIVFTTLKDNWRSGRVDARSIRRWSALREPLAPRVYAGAPCLRQMPTGETLLSFQQSDSGDMNRARIVVCIGDADARSFSGPSHPFPQTPGAPQHWASLFVKGERTVTAVCNVTINGVRGVWSVDGRFVRPLESPRQ